MFFSLYEQKNAESIRFKVNKFPRSRGGYASAMKIGCLNHAARFDYLAVRASARVSDVSLRTHAP